jgi:diacylglycerol kinase family enzyme
MMRKLFQVQGELMGRTILVILNPIAGKGNARSREHEIVSWLTEAQNKEIITAYKVLETECVGHAVELARAEANNYDVVCAAGGDGTVNEVVNGLMQARSDYNKEHGEDKRYAIGIIPIGR